MRCFVVVVVMVVEINGMRGRDGVGEWLSFGEFSCACVSFALIPFHFAGTICE
ncbi:unnamed protein product [Anisakis simplex]|uniref:Uncharacterized protein n=1 Tax=Anisakis simplex TaxID=6269 RepID=A0A3P6UGQ5_ANISI|nr:unnamed protein product [Anisakis simplex]